MIPDKLISDYIREKVKTFGVWCSGGADSSLLLYLLTKEIINDNLNIDIIPMTMRRMRPQNPYYAAQVIEFLEEHLNFKYKDHLVFYPSYDNINPNDACGDQHFFRNEQYKLLDEGVIDFYYSATSQSPPLEVQKKFSDKLPDEILEDRDPNNLEKRIWFDHCGQPLLNADKKELASIYEKENLTESLFPLTRSCESDYHINEHCGECWWCQERLWAFGRLV